MSAGEPIWYEIYLLCWPPCAKLLYTLNGFQYCFVAMHFTAHFGCFFLQHWLARIHIMTMTLAAAECIRCNIRRLQCFTISVFFKALSTRFKLLWPNGLIVGTDRCNIKHTYLVQWSLRQILAQTRLPGAILATFLFPSFCSFFNSRFSFSIAHFSYLAKIFHQTNDK